MHKQPNLNYFYNTVITGRHSRKANSSSLYGNRNTFNKNIAIGFASFPTYSVKNLCKRRKILKKNRIDAHAKPFVTGSRLKQKNVYAHNCGELDFLGYFFAY